MQVSGLQNPSLNQTSRGRFRDNPFRALLHPAAGTEKKNFTSPSSAFYVYLTGAGLLDLGEDGLPELNAR